MTTTTYTYKILNVPGSTGTVAEGINSSGEVVGAYATSSGDFYDNGSTYTTLSFDPEPGLVGMDAKFITNSGYVVGTYSTGGFTFYNFLYYNGTYTDLGNDAYFGDARAVASRRKGRMATGEGQ